MEESDILRYFPKIRRTHEGFNACCPRCGDRAFRLSWNLEKNIGCCFHAECQWHTSKGGVTRKRLLAFFGETPGLIPTAATEILEQAEDLEVSLPKEFQPIKKLNGYLQESLFDYFESRGIPKRLVLLAKVGYCTEGRLWGYLIFPVMDEQGQVAWWQGRRFKNRTPKFFNPPSQRKGELLYRVDYPKRPHRMILVESIFNVLTLSSGDSHRVLVLGLLGKTMTGEQREKITFYERCAKELIVALDPDAKREAVDIASQFSGIFPSIRIAQFPEGEDVNSVGRERAWGIIDHAPAYNDRHRMEFLAKKGS